MKTYIYKIVFSVIFLLFPLLFSCNNTETKVIIAKVETGRDIQEIKKSGKLIVVTDFSSINYFIYRGKTLGFQYELLQELSDYSGLEIEVKVNNDLKENFDQLINGEVDIIASNLTINPERRKIVDFTIPHSQTSQVLVQRSGSKFGFEREKVLRDPLKLIGKTVYVQKYSAHAQHLRNLSSETGERIIVIEVPIETEKLIRMVAKGEIEYTVADQDVAMVNDSYMDGIDVETILSFPKEQAWAVRKSSPGLKNEVDKWMTSFKKTRRYAVLQKKYFRSNRINSMVNSNYYSGESGKISPYDEIFKQAVQGMDWDWKLIAAMVYQESRFNPSARSWAGAFGIMQLMPGTAKRFGVNVNSSVPTQVKAGVALIQWLDDRLDDLVEDPVERKKFILASYNIGFGHVQDAIKLAQKYGKNPQIWEDNVEYFLLKKSEKKYYTDKVVKYGYARGIETYNYVREIIDRYSHYKNISEFPELAQSVTAN